MKRIIILLFILCSFLKAQDRIFSFLPKSVSRATDLTGYIKADIESGDYQFSGSPILRGDQFTVTTTDGFVRLQLFNNGTFLLGNENNGSTYITSDDNEGLIFYSKGNKSVIVTSVTTGSDYTIGETNVPTKTITFSDGTTMTVLVDGK